MSTKAIRKALERLATLEDGSTPEVLQALLEVEAIERMAKSVAARGGLPAYKTGLSRADEIGIGMHMADIAKDAP